MHSTRRLIPVTCIKVIESTPIMEDCDGFDK